MKKIKLTTTELRNIIKESVINICEEYYSTRKQGKHNYHKFLDDEDFMYVVELVRTNIEGMTREEILENEDGIKYEIQDNLDEVLHELAKDNLGYKYTNIPYGKKMNIVCDIFDYIIENA